MNLKHHILSLAVALFVSTMGAGTSFAMPSNADTAETAPNEIIVDYDSGRLTVKGAEAETPIVVTNMLGVRVYAATISQGEKNTFIVYLNRGIYIVKVGGTAKRIIVK